MNIFNLILLGLLFLSTHILYSQGQDCSSPFPINSLPFSITGKTTCGFDDDFGASSGCTNNYMTGDDFVFKITSPTQYTGNIRLENTNAFTGLFLLDDCPDAINVQCLANDVSSSGNPEIGTFTFLAGQTYFLIISTYSGGSFGDQCTPFDIHITASSAPNVQDCNGAIPICKNTYNNNNSYVGTGNVNNEIDGIYSCLASGEKNNVWYTFTVQNSGALSFNINPNSPGDDYDWAVYNLTNNACSEVFTNPNLEVSCNFSPDPGTTGPNGSGAGNCEPVIPVQNGESYAIIISNFSSTQSGYNIDFSASSATLYDLTPPSLNPYSGPTYCGMDEIEISFSENILCSTISTQDFTLTGNTTNYQITSITSPTCDLGGNQDKKFTIKFTPAILHTDLLKLCLTGADGYATDLCGNVASQQCISFSVTKDLAILDGANQITCHDEFGLINPVRIGSAGSVSGGVLPYTYQWSPATQLNDANIEQPLASPVSDTQYKLKVVDANGCEYTSSSISVTINDLAPPTFSPIDETCPGTKDGSIIANPASGGTPPFTFQWNTTPIQFTSTINQLHAGTYDVIVKDANNCAANATQEIAFIGEITAQFSTTPNQEYYDNLFYLKNLSDPTNSTYSWSFGDNTTSTDIHPSHSYEKPGNYIIQLIATHPIGCEDTVQQIVKVIEPISIYLPNSITPNADGRNDTFFFSGSGLVTEELEFIIYNRFGEKIYSTNEMKPWDGRNNGRPVAAGVYTYSLTVKDIKDEVHVKKGKVTVIR